jgi:diguanylate cyclase (GGDEF)-like protein/PAS domain S-box-containing protein
MKVIKITDFKKNLLQLRNKAEVQLIQSRTSAKLAPSFDELHLLHELQVHQIELEMQNEQLRQTQLALEESNDRYFDLYEFAPIGYLCISNHGLISELNWKATAMFGLGRKQLLKHRFAEFIVDEDKGRWQRQFANMKELVSGEELSFDMRFTHNDGTMFYAGLNCMRMDSDEQTMMRVTLLDITPLKQSEVALRIASTIFESQEGMMVTNAKGTIIRVNQAFTNITGYSAEEAVGKNPRLLSSGRHDTDFYTVMWSSVKKKGYWAGNIWNKRKNGEIYPEYLTVTSVKDKDDVVSNYVATLTDISTSNAASEEIKNLAFYDPLTHLPNRRLLLDRLRHALNSSQQSGNCGAVLFLDIDHFKTLNDTLGHDVGDLLLQQVSERLSACVREGDTVARMGGDEFVVVLEGLDEDAITAATQAEITANKILSKINESYQLDRRRYYSSISVGVTIFIDHQTALEELLKQADIAMYQAKMSGRNAVRFFNPQMQEVIDVRASMENDLRLAVENQQFCLYYQIQVDHLGKPFGAEALLRWQNAERGLVSPLEFIPIAEETGLILPIGQWVLNAACAQLKHWQQDELSERLTLSVNVSAKQFRQHDFVKQVQSCIQHHGINPMRLKLELTESVLLENVEDTILSMTALGKLGIQFSLDDFGTGYSSLQYLKRLPLYQLKIDQSFVRDIATDPSDQAIVNTIIAMAHNLELDVIAEGVETKLQQQRLEKKGCKRYQGFMFGKPMPINEFNLALRM